LQSDIDGYLEIDIGGYKLCDIIRNKVEIFKWILLDIFIGIIAE
jgi:hypothetical protein